MEGGEEDANCNYGAGDPGREPVHIAVMRRKVSQKDSHISNVSVLLDLACAAC